MCVGGTFSLQLPTPVAVVHSPCPHTHTHARTTAPHPFSAPPKLRTHWLTGTLIPGIAPVPGPLPERPLGRWHSGFRVLWHRSKCGRAAYCGGFDWTTISEYWHQQNEFPQGRATRECFVSPVYVDQREKLEKCGESQYICARKRCWGRAFGSFK
jgi:hypothetical protein